MKPVDCPFRAADRLIEQIGGAAKVVMVDMHAEATSDKQLLARYLDGRVSAVLGTHTHVATADEQILEHGTAYQTDVGMTGPHDSILGRRYDRVLSSTLTCRAGPFRRRHRRPTAQRRSGDDRSGNGKGACDQPGELEPGGRAAPFDRFRDRKKQAVRGGQGLRGARVVETMSRSSRRSPRARPLETAWGSSKRRPSR